MAAILDIKGVSLSFGGLKVVDDPQAAERERDACQFEGGH